MGNLNRNCDPRRHAWLMTDARIDAVLMATIRGLPPGAGVVFRHRHLSRGERHRLFLRIRRLAQARRLRLAAAGGLPGAAAHGGTHPYTAPVHDRRQAIAARRRGAQWLFVSPIHPTRSHPGAPALGVRRALAIVRGTGGAAVALGGMDARRWLACRHHGFDGWAAIDGLAAPSRPPHDQKRKAVPT